MANVAAITSGTTFTVPADFGSLVSIEAIGAGANGTAGSSGGGASGGDGGAYAIATSLSGIAAGNTYNIHIGVANGTQGTSIGAGTADTWFNSAASTLYAQGAAQSAGGPGLNFSCIPSSGANSGGHAGTGATGDAYDGGGGGGGAAGPNGAGQSGSNGTGSASIGNRGPGGNGDNGFGGPGDGSSNASGGDPGSEWTYNILNGTSAAGTIGAGGGGCSGWADNSGDAFPGSNAGVYGAGGGGGGGGSAPPSFIHTAGTATGGLIIFTYIPKASGLPPKRIARRFY